LIEVIGAARRYIWPARERENLTIRTGVTVDRIDIANGRARAVVLADGETIAGDRIVLAAGAFGSPAILLRSGVGPADASRALGIDVVADRPGVGENLVDHPLIILVFAAPNGGRADAITPAYQTLLTARSSQWREPGYDFHIVPQSVLPADGTPTGSVFALLCSLVRPRSVGRLWLASRDPAQLPRVETGYLKHADDRTRMIELVRLARTLAWSPPLVDFRVDELVPGPSADSDAAIEAFLEAQVQTYFHPVGSCAMGSGPNAVVDPRGKVHDVDGLWVFDASIMPTIPGINTNLPTIMIAERGAAWLAEA
jgi:choline dehydrogenase